MCGECGGRGWGLGAIVILKIPTIPTLLLTKKTQNLF
jgi:hypothetical protein